MKRFSYNSYILNADFDNISGLKVGDIVEISGVQVGKVVGISLARNRAHVQMRLNKSVTVDSQAIAAIKTRA
jgi:phospholipid/cholesterol/gamma-HCH transport system substrate-binding protein